MHINFGLEFPRLPEVKYIHSVAGPSGFKVDLGSVEIKLDAKEAERLLEGLAREMIIQREQATMKGRAQ